MLNYTFKSQVTEIQALIYLVCFQVPVQEYKPDAHMEL